ncbi:MAG: HDOD domain-containing protein [Pirellulales bacterium]
MLKILFVDDEEHLLQGLKRLLHGHRHRWQMSFCNSGAEALRKLESDAYDVIVTDMRMPEVDGSRVLFESYLNSPSTLRCVLSGQSEHAQTCKVTGTAHQFLSKPTQKQDLEQVVERVEQLSVSRLTPELRLAATRLAALPVQGAVLHQLEAELKRDLPSHELVADLIVSDVGMSAKVVQLVWSSFFGLPRKSLCPSEAVQLLGIDMLRELVLEYGLFSPYISDDEEPFSIEELCRHSLAVAKHAEAITYVETQDHRASKQAYFAGLTHDIGKLILSHQFPAMYGHALRAAREREMSLWEAELEVFGASHADVGSYLLALWGFPTEVIQAVAYYRTPGTCDQGGFGTATAVHVANLLNRTNHFVRTPQQQLLYGSEHLAQSGLARRTAAWCEAVKNAVAGPVLLN